MEVLLPPCFVLLQQCVCRKVLFGLIILLLSVWHCEAAQGASFFAVKGNYEYSHHHLKDQIYSLRHILSSSSSSAVVYHRFAPKECVSCPTQKHAEFSKQEVRSDNKKCHWYLSRRQQIASLYWHLVLSWNQQFFFLNANVNGLAAVKMT